MKEPKKVLVLPTIENIDEIASGLTQPMEVIKGSFRKMEFRFTDNVVQFLHNDGDIKKFSSVWLSSFWDTRDLAFAVERYLSHHDIPHTHVEESTSKITDQVQLSLNGLNAPNTFFVDRKGIDDYVETIEEICGYPAVIKDTKGSRGMYSKLVNNREELLEEYSKLPRYKKYLFQTYIPNDYDWGVLVVNGKAVSAEKSYGVDSDFRNNACNGAKEEFVDIKDVPKEICDIAVKASKVLGLNWSRSDIIIHKETGEPYLLEVNRFPGTTSGTTEITGARAFLESHLKSIY